MNGDDRGQEIREISHEIKKLRRSVNILSVLMAILLVICLAIGIRSLRTGSAAKQQISGGSTSEVTQQYEEEKTTAAAAEIEREKVTAAASEIDEKGEYSTAADVAAYIHKYHKLPPNYVTKSEAKKMGLKGSECPDKYGIMVGGDRFGNREKLLPDDDYYEADVDYNGDRRGVNRLVYTKDGTVYHTTDHYNSYKQLY